MSFYLGYLKSNTSCVHLLLHPSPSLPHCSTESNLGYPFPPLPVQFPNQSSYSTLPLSCPAISLHKIKYTTLLKEKNQSYVHVSGIS